MSTKPVIDPAVQMERLLRGGSVEDAKERLAPKLEADAAKIALVTPAASAAAKSAASAASAAQQLAEQTAYQSRLFFESIDQRLYILGKLKVRMAVVNRLHLSDADEKQICYKVIDSFVAAEHSQSINTISTFQCTVSNLMRLKAIQPHLGSYLQALEFEAAKLERDIVEFATDNNANLGELLRLKAEEPTQDTEWLQFRAVDAFAALVKTISRPVVAENAQV